MHECARASASGCMGHHITTHHDASLRPSTAGVIFFPPQIQTQTIWHWPSSNRTSSMLTGRLRYNPIGHAGRGTPPIGWGACVSVETGRTDEEVDRLLRLRTAPRFVWGLRPYTTLLAPNKSRIRFTRAHLTLITAEAEVWKLAGIPRAQRQHSHIRHLLLERTIL